MASKLSLRGGFWSWVSGVDLNTLGYVIVGLFAATWIAATLIWRVARIEDRWSAAAPLET
jgi:high-affinity nickel-transport protein